MCCVLIYSYVCNLKPAFEPRFQPLFSVTPRLIFQTLDLFYSWSPFVNYSQTLSLKHCLFPWDWISAPLVTLPAGHSCPTQSSAGFMCVRAWMKCACLQTAQWDGRVHPAPGFITSICFLWASRSCGEITAEHLGKASAWFRSRSTPSNVPLPTLHWAEARCAAFHTGMFLNVWTNILLIFFSLFVSSGHFPPPSRMHSLPPCCSPPPPSSSQKVTSYLGLSRMQVI